jgi:zinc/manganese transport system substrate-binding protein
MMHFLMATAGALLWSVTPGFGEKAGPVAIVAAENVYGDVARQIGGPDVTVTSIISTPGQDPHQFEASPATARALAGADIVISNGASYDPWVARLLTAAKSAPRTAIVAADLVNARAGDNPHLWYDPATMPAVATKLAAALAARDPAHRTAYEQRLKDFLVSLAPITTRIASIRAKHAGTPVTATEPVFGLMAKALGFTMRNERFQLAVMNETEPAATDVAAIQDDLTGHKVKLLLHNTQTSNVLTERLLAIARTAGVPVVGISETEPSDTTYQAWIAAELDRVDKALGGDGS